MNFNATLIGQMITFFFVYLVLHEICLASDYDGAY